MWGTLVIPGGRGRGPACREEPGTGFVLISCAPLGSLLCLYPAARLCARGILVIARGCWRRSTRGRPCTHFSYPSGLAASPRPGLHLRLPPSTLRPGGLVAGRVLPSPRLVPAGRPHLLPRSASALAGRLARRTRLSDWFRKPAGASPFWKISFEIIYLFLALLTLPLLLCGPSVVKWSGSISSLQCGVFHCGVFSCPPAWTQRLWLPDLVAPGHMWDLCGAAPCLLHGQADSFFIFFLTEYHLLLMVLIKLVRVKRK